MPAPTAPSFQKPNVFVGCGSADVADPRQFADVQLPVFVGGIVAKESDGDRQLYLPQLSEAAIHSLCRHDSAMEQHPQSQLLGCGESVLHSILH